jgi:hypothetical protein
MTKPEHRPHWHMFCERACGWSTNCPETSAFVSELCYRVEGCMRPQQQSSPGTSLEHPYHWFHTNAHVPMQALTSELSKPILFAVEDPYVKWASHLWFNNPDMFDYFVPLDVQKQYECEQIDQTQVTWQDTLHNRNFRVRVCNAHSSVRPEIVHQLAFRVTAMSTLDVQPCTSLELLWFPSRSTKQVHGIGKPGGYHSRKQRVVLLRRGSDVGCGACRGGTRSTTCTSVARCRTLDGASPPPVVQHLVHSWNPFQINTGATYRNTCNTVTIWRMEEAHKTFLHEMMHGFGWDFSPSTADVSQWVKERFAVDPKTEVRLFEAYVETWATLLNTYMVEVLRANQSATPANPSASVLETKTDHTPSDALLRQVLDQLEHERMWVLFQCAKILVHSGFRDWSTFHTPLPHQHEQPVFRQTTSVFSYFIVRAALLWDIDWFVVSFSRVRFASNPGTSQKLEFWWEHLDRVFASTTFARTIDTCIGIVHELQSYVSPSPEDMLVLETMRMTCVEEW